MKKKRDAKNNIMQGKDMNPDINSAKDAAEEKTVMDMENTDLKNTDSENTNSENTDPEKETEDSKDTDTAEEVKEESKEDAKEEAKEETQEEPKQESEEDSKKEIKEEIKEEATEKPVEEVTEEVKENAEESQGEPKKPKLFSRNKKFIIAGSVLLLLVILYGCLTSYYRNVFFIRTTINGLDCSNMTAKEAEELIRNDVENYELSITFRDGTTEIISGDSIEYKYISDDSFQGLIEQQNPFAWVTGLFSPASYEVPETVEYRKSRLASEYYALESTAEDKMSAPVDAYVTYEEGAFVIVPEDKGNQLDHHAFLLELNAAVAAGETAVKAEEYEVYARPSVFSDSADLAKECEQLNELATVSVTYTLPNGETSVLDGNEVRNWLTVDEDGNYTLVEDDLKDHISAFVKQFAAETDTAGAARTFQSTMQGEVTVEGGTYGWKIDQKAEAAQLAEEIANHSVVTREPIYATEEITTENSGIGDTYVEIDLTNQHLWYYIDGELYMESDIVSGTYNTASRRTPAGIYLLTYKQKNKVLRGRQREDGTYEYESPVSFWMPFNKGIGMHDASWRGSFGGTIYKYSGSHGCINMPYKNAEKVYEKIDKETPIICFY